MATPKKRPEDLLKRGRKRLFSSPEAMEAKAEEYFAYCANRTKEIYVEKLGDHIVISDPETPGIAGLCYFLGFEDRHGLAEYASLYPEFSATCRKIRLRVESKVENRLNEAKNPVGAIFNLKNNFAWKDKQEVDQNVSGGFCIVEKPWPTITQQIKPAADKPDK
jgi:hypothetical protein